MLLPPSLRFTFCSEFTDQYIELSMFKGRWSKLEETYFTSNLF